MIQLLLVLTTLHLCSCFLSHSLLRLGIKHGAVEIRKQSLTRVAASSKVQDGSLIEYISAKGSKRLALVNKTIGAHIEVVNDAKKSFSVPLSRVTYHINGTYQFGDLLRLNDILFDLKAAQAERVWEEACSRSTDSSNIHLNISYVCERVYGVVEPIKLYASIRLMNTFGTVFFKQVSKNSQLTLFQPLPPNVVQENLHDRAALREFKQRYSKLNVGRSSMMNNNEMNIDVPDRILAVIAKYSEGLKQIILKSHPWHAKGLARRKAVPDLITKGKELLEYLELAPTAKNAKKVLEIINIWPTHTNVEKYVMNLRDEFPPEVNDEAQYLLDNSNVIPDPDERLRRDLRYLGCYAIDSEGTSEIDDALSIEYLEDGQEKLWVHIADVSRWIRPGSQLSLEAERRMVTVYMPDERISMFPDILSTELLSLGAGVESYALSLGVTLSAATGEVMSYEICPSKIRVTKRVSYVQLEEILSHPLDEGSNVDEKMHSDLNNLNRWAKLRHQYRIRKGCLDEYVRDKTDLILSVKKERVSNINRMSVTAYPVWNNATANSLVTEYMILMCDTIGQICTSLKAPVWYKVQVASPALSTDDTLLRHNETSFFRTIRLMRHLKQAVDSKFPGPHCTSGADAYVQCTSPIRRYHDLYNHYRLKAAMHSASLAQEWVDNAAEEAGINKLDKMATAEARMETLNAVRLVTRQRQLYWLQMYIDKLCSNAVSSMLRSPLFDCVVAEKHTSSFGDEGIEIVSTFEEDSLNAINGSHDIPFYDAHIIQVGSFNTYKLYSPHNYRFGDTLKGYLYKRHTNPTSYVIIPETVSLPDLPPALVLELTAPINQITNV